MADLAGGARIPARLLKLVAACGDDEAAVQQAGIDYATDQCDGLLKSGVDGIHFYTLNKSRATRDIFSNLGINHPHP
jgi:methylenetetrahydrofolate reductase (NADPH)